MEKLTGKEELAELLGKTKKTIENWLAEDKYHIRSYMFQVGKSWMIDTEGYEALIAEMKEGEVRES